MNKTYIIGGVVVLLLLVVGFFVFQQFQNDRTVAVTVNQLIDRPDLEFGFSYPSGEAGLSLVEPPAGEGNLLGAFLLFPTDSYIEYQNEEGAETPASISIFVFAEDDSDSESGRITRLQNWASDNSALTKYDLALNTPDIVEVDGVKAIRYDAEGVYPQTIYLASYTGRIYMFVGQFEEDGDYLDTTFGEVISAVTFY